MQHHGAIIERNWRECSAGQEHVCKYYTTQQLSMMNATTVNALPAKNLQRGEHLSLLSLSISLSRWKRGCHLRWNTGSGLWVTLVVAPGQGPSSQVQLTTEPGANFGTRRVRTAASPSLAIRATSSTALLRCQTLNGSQPHKFCPNAVL